MHFNHFLHCEILTLQPGKALSYQIKMRLSRSWGKPSGHLGFPIAQTVWFIAIVYPFYAGKEGPQLATTGVSQKFPRAAAPVGVF